MEVLCEAYASRRRAQLFVALVLSAYGLVEFLRESFAFLHGRVEAVELGFDAASLHDHLPMCFQCLLAER